MGEDIVKRIKLSDGVSYEELYNSMETKILEWEKENRGNPYFCKITSPIVKDLNQLNNDGNSQNYYDYVLLQEDGNIVIANPLFFRNADISKWKNIKSVVNTAALTESGEVLSANLSMVGKIPFRDEDFSDWHDVKKLIPIGEYNRNNYFEIAALQNDGIIKWRSKNNNQEEYQYIVEETSAWENIDDIFAFSKTPGLVYGNCFVFLAVDTQGKILVSGNDNLKQKVAKLSKYPKMIRFVSEDDIIATYDDGHSETTLENGAVNETVSNTDGMDLSEFCFTENRITPWKDIVGIAKEKNKGHAIFVKADGSAFEDFENEYLDNITDVKEIGIIDTFEYVILTNDNMLRFFRFERESAPPINNCEKFIILDQGDPDLAVGQIKRLNVFVLHEGNLTVYDCESHRDPKVCGTFSGVKNIFASDDGDTVCVRFENGRLKTFGDFIYDSNIDFDGATMYYYGQALENGTIALASKYEYSRVSDPCDVREQYTGIFGLQKNGRCFALSDRNWRMDRVWHLGVRTLFQMEEVTDAKCIIPNKFLYLDSNNTLRSIFRSVEYKNATSFSGSMYYVACILDNGHMVGTKDTKYGCCNFDKIENPKKVLAFSMGTVVLTSDGKLKSLCTNAQERAYEVLPVKNGVKDIFYNYSFFAILCKNGDLYICNRQKAVHDYSGLTTMPFTAWKRVMGGVDCIDSKGEEAYAVLVTDKNNSSAEDAESNGDSKTVTVVIPSQAEAKKEWSFDVSRDKIEIKKYKGKNSHPVIPHQIGQKLVTAIGDSAFENCSLLTGVTIPDSVTTIGECVFCGCDALISVDIPDSVKELGSNSFMNCSSLTEIRLSKQLQEVDSQLFSGCTSLESVNIPNGVVYISESAFEGCTALKEINIPNKVTEIECGAFMGCTSLTDITIPDGVTAIYEETFKGCTSLRNLSIPDSVESVDFSAFCNDSQNKVLLGLNYTIHENGKYIGNKNNPYMLLMAVTDKGCSEFAIPDTTKFIINNAFEDCESLQSIILPKKILTIVDNAFANCSSLKRIDIPDEVSEIGSSAFSGCTSLTSITLPNSVKTICDDAFKDCKSLENIVIPDGVTQIGIGAFSYCEVLKNINIPNSVTEIGSFAFSGCKTLTDINLPGKISRIETFVFSGCTSLESVVIPDDVNEIEMGAFESCTSLTRIVIPNSVTTIGNNAFKDCKSLESIVIPDGVTQIGRETFSHCEVLKNIIIPDSVTKIDMTAFFGTENITIRAHSDSFAKKYAIKNNIKLEIID